MVQAHHRRAAASSARTPKVANRTVPPLLFALSPLLIIGYSVLIAWRDAQLGNWGNAAFATFNALTATTPSSR